MTTIYNGPDADRTSPTFVARFADGIMTRMTCNSEDLHLDLGRGIKLSQAAYESRTGKSPPAIVEARFVRPFSDETIWSCSRAELDEMEQRALAFADTQ